MSAAPERIMARYDDLILDSGDDGRKVADAREELVTAVLDDPDSFDLPDTPQLVRAFVEGVITDTRNSRARRRLTLFQACHDAVSGLTVMGRDDPILDLALRVGTSDGLDKSLRHFSVEDWLDVLGASAANVEDAINADRNLRALVNPIVAAYGRKRATRLEDMFADAAA